MQPRDPAGETPGTLASVRQEVGIYDPNPDALSNRYKGSAQEPAAQEKRDTETPLFEERSCNVFADLGLDDADEQFTRAKLGFHVYRFLTGRKLKQRDIADPRGIKQPQQSHLLNGHFSQLSTIKLLDSPRRLDHKVRIEIRPHQPGEPYQEIGFGM